MRNSYPSDISQEQFETIRSTLEASKKKTKPRQIDLYEIFCGILYVLKTGCQWRMLPHDFPAWQTVYSYFRIWKSKETDSKDSLLEMILNQLVVEERVYEGRTEETSFLIFDSQSVKNTDTAEEKGYDAGKKVSGIKRHLGVDTGGRPHFIHITTADSTDREGAIEGIKQSSSCFINVTNVLVDGAYTGENFANEIQRLLCADVEVAKRNELHKFEVIPQRWIVERSFGWIEKCRRLWKNCERQLNTSLHMVILAFISLLLNRIT
jgi:transposase